MRLGTTWRTAAMGAAWQQVSVRIVPTDQAPDPCLQAWSLWQCWRIAGLPAPVMLPVTLSVPRPGLQVLCDDLPAPSAADQHSSDPLQHHPLGWCHRDDDWRLCQRPSGAGAAWLPPAWLPPGAQSQALLPASHTCAQSGDVVLSDDGAWQLLARYPTEIVGHIGASGPRIEQVLAGLALWQVVRPDPLHPAGPAAPGGLRWGQR